MADTTTRKFDIQIGSTYNGAGVKNATADMAKLRKELSLPAMGPLTRDDQLSLAMAQHSVRRVQLQRERNDIFRLDALPSRDFDFSGLQGQGSDITRLRGGMRPQTRAEMDDEHERKSLMQQSRALRRGAKLFGAAALGEGAAHLLSVPKEAVDQHEKMLKDGYSKGQAFNEALYGSIPVIGDLANGFRDIRQYITEELLSDEGKNRRAREQQQDNRDIRESVTDRRNERRQSLLINARDIDEDAIARGQFAGRFGFVRDKLQVKADLQKKNKATDRLAALYGNFGSSEQQDEYKRQIQAGRTADEKEAEDKLFQINKEANAKREDDARSHADRLKSIDDETRTSRLEIEGRFLTSKLVAIREEANKELEDAKRRHHDDLLDPDKNPKLAEEQYTKDVEAIQRRRREKITDANKLEARDVGYIRREHGEKLLDTEADQAERRLRLSGRVMESEKLGLKRQLADRLEQIDLARDKEIDAHKEREPEIRRFAEEDRAAALQDYTLSQDELQAKRRREYQVHGLETITGPTHLLTGAGGQILNSSGDPQVHETRMVRKAIEDLGRKLDRVIAPQTPTASRGQF